MNRHYLMCPPTYFDVVDRTNPWMRPEREADRDAALAQWERLVSTYRDLGHEVSVLEPVPGLTDMVFTANGAVVVGGRALLARFRHGNRQRESEAHRAWLADAYEVRQTRHPSEGEGDFLLAGRVVLAGAGFRTDQRAHLEARQFLGHPVLSLQLVDECFYHLDTALLVLDDHTIAYHPGAFSDHSRRLLAHRYPDAVLATADDARRLALNAVSDGRHVVLPQEAGDFADRLRERGYTPVPVDLSELRASGGGPKCCTLELRGA